MSRIMLSSVAAVAVLASAHGAAAQTEIQWWHAMGGALGEDWRARAEAVGAVGMNVGRRKLTAEGALAIKRAGYVLSVWTVNDPDEARTIVGMGADCIITDAPDVILRALD